MPYPPWRHPSPLVIHPPHRSSRHSQSNSPFTPSPRPMLQPHCPFAAGYTMPPRSATSLSQSPPFTEIIPRLYLGDHTAAENPSLLTALGITHILSAMRGAVYIPVELCLRHSQISLEDLPFAELAEHLPGTTSFIEDAMRDPNARVLVHCMQGVSRSASVVAAYLMAAYGWTPQQAVAFVKSKRGAADPNSGFVAQLAEYGELLRRQSFGR